MFSELRLPVKAGRLADRQLEGCLTSRCVALKRLVWCEALNDARGSKGSKSSSPSRREESRSMRARHLSNQPLKLAARMGTMRR